MIINGENYIIPEITFGFAYKMKQTQGVDLKELVAKVAQFDEPSIVMFMSFAVGGDQDKAIELISQHFTEGGDFIDIIQEINKAVEESGFFQAWLRTMEKAKALQKPVSAKKK